MPARVRKIRHDDETRAKIQAAQIINRLQKCIDGEVELSAQQVSAAKTLLDKVLPNLQAVDGTLTHDMSDNFADFMARIASNGNRLVKTEK